MVRKGRATYAGQRADKMRPPIDVLFWRDTPVVDVLNRWIDTHNGDYAVSSFEASIYMIRLPTLGQSIFILSKDPADKI